jgi:cystathionine beta-lyase
MNKNFDIIHERKGTNSVKYDLLETIFGHSDLLPMWVADMDFKAPQPVLDALQKRIDHGIFGYTFLSDGYYQAIAQWHKKRQNLKLNREWIYPGIGIVPTLNFMVQVYTNPSDKIIVQPPVYYPFFNAAKDHGRKLIQNELILQGGRYYIDFDDLEAQVDQDTKLFFLCHPHNPGGRIWSSEELQKLGQFCLDNDILLISDEIHSDLIIPGNTFTPALSLPDEISQNIITCMAPSKTFNLAGLSSSYIICKNPAIMEKYTKYIEKLHISQGNVFGGIALEAAYSDEGEAWLQELMKYIQDNYTFLKSFLNKEIPGVKIMEPEATYLVWLDFSEFFDNAHDLQQFTRKKSKLALNDGILFGKGGHLFERINIACPKKILEKALNQLKNAFDQL